MNATDDPWGHGPDQTDEIDRPDQAAVPEWLMVGWETKMTWFRGLTRAPRRLFKLLFNPQDSSAPFDPDEEAPRDRAEVLRLDEATAYSSESAYNPGMHVLALDIDHPATLIPSATPGHFHLVIDHEIPWEQYEKILLHLGAAGVIEPGYADAGRRRKATFLRLPWHPKGS